MSTIVKAIEPMLIATPRLAAPAASARSVTTARTATRMAI